jgi:hypothetical protein
VNIEVSIFRKYFLINVSILTYLSDYIVMLIHFQIAESAPAVNIRINSDLKTKDGGGVRSRPKTHKIVHLFKA